MLQHEELIPQNDRGSFATEDSVLGRKCNNFQYTEVAYTTEGGKYDGIFSNTACLLVVSEMQMLTKLDHC